MKVWNYVLLTSGMMFLIALSGIEVPGITEFLANIGLSTTEGVTLNSESFFQYLFSTGTGLLMIASIGAGIVAGLLTQGKSENYILLGLITSHLIYFIGSMVHLINFARENSPVWISMLIIAILGPLTVGYLLALAEFFRGTD